MAKDSEKKYAFPVTFGSAAVVIIFHLAFYKEYTTLLFADFIFTLVWGLLLIIWAICGWIVLDKMNDPNFDKFRWYTLIVAAALCIWVGTWSAQYRADKSSNIEYKYEKK